MVPSSFAAGSVLSASITTGESSCGKSEMRVEDMTLVTNKNRVIR